MKMISGKKLLRKSTPAPAAHVFQIKAAKISSKEEEVEGLHPSISRVIQNFNDIFEEPKKLPPERGCEHNVILKPGAQPIFSNPCIYP